MKRPLDLESLERRLPAMKAALESETRPRQRLGLLFRIVMIEEALRR